MNKHGTSMGAKQDKAIESNELGSMLASIATLPLPAGLGRMAGHASRRCWQLEPHCTLWADFFALFEALGQALAFCTQRKRVVSTNIWAEEWKVVG
jgi:hypothetical protein